MPAKIIKPVKNSMIYLIFGLAKKNYFSNLIILPGIFIYVCCRTEDNYGSRSGEYNILKVRWEMIFALAYNGNRGTIFHMQGKGGI